MIIEQDEVKSTKLDSIIQTSSKLAMVVRLMIKDMNIKWEARYEELNSYRDLRKEFRETGKVVVSALHIKNTIFADEQDNIYFRVLHDWLHLYYHLGFDYDSEVRIAKITRGLIYNYCRSKLYMDDVTSTEISTLAFTDIYHQAKYYNEFGKFVTNQLDFVVPLYVNELKKEQDS